MNDLPNLAGEVFVVSAPSGTGKTTLNRRLLQTCPQLAMSVSYTTRAKRDSEVDGEHYHFVDDSEFRKMIADERMLEYAEVFGTMYGTALDEIERITLEKKSALLEIDVQGWEQARAKLPGAVSIFILPPSIDSLWERLLKRATEPEDVRWRRLRTARAEILKGELYSHYIINDHLDRAYGELESLVRQGHSPSLSVSAGRDHCKALVEAFDRSPLIQELKEKFQ